MTAPRFQFTIRRLMWATFWAAVTAAARSVSISKIEGFSLGPRDKQFSPMNGIEIPVLAARLLGPFIAVGALFGRARRGLMWGLIVFVPIALCLGLIYLMLAGTRWDS